MLQIGDRKSNKFLAESRFHAQARRDCGDAPCAQTRAPVGCLSHFSPLCHRKFTVIRMTNRRTDLSYRGDNRGGTRPELPEIVVDLKVLLASAQSETWNPDPEEISFLAGDTTLISEKLLAALRERWRAYRKGLKQCRKHPSEEAVHRVRVQTRRLLSALELLGSFVTHSRVQ